MTPSIGKKFSIFVATVVLISTAAIGVVAYRLVETKLAEVLRHDTLDTATLLASRVRNELRHLAEKARILAAAALEEFRNPDDQIRFLEDNLTIDDQFVGMTLWRRSPASHDQWTPVFRLTRPDGDPSRLDEKDFKLLDLKYPMDLNRVGEGAVEVSVGSLKDAPILRMAVPLVRKRGKGFTQILAIEVKQERMTAAFTEATAHFSFIMDRSNRIVTQTDPTHFTFGEDLSYLPILQLARSSDSPNGNLDYYEFPGGSLQYAAFHKVGYADLIIVAQASRADVLAVLKSFTRQAAIAIGIAALLSAAFGLIASWKIVGAKLARIGNALARLGNGNLHVSFPDQHLGDEIGEFSRRLQEFCDEQKDRDKAHGTFAKLKDRKLKSRLKSGDINCKGERMNAMVLHCHLHGIEKVVAKADPELLIQLLNQFDQSVSDAIESNHGIVDHMHGGSVVAYWGVPIADANDTHFALSTCLKIRKFARTFNEALTARHLPEVVLGMGLHYGPVVAGQVGTEDRLEYTALGEAIEYASRIQSFTDQFGTDLLMTAQTVERAPRWYTTEQVSAGDENTPQLFELVGVDTAQFENPAAVAGVKRKRGRPRKITLPEELAEPSSTSDDEAA